jgi:RHS repeat-associated protein
MTNIDNLTYGYNSNTNRLNTISDATGNAAGFNVNGAATGYGYDLNGNYLSDPYKKITSSKYYFNNLPKDIVVSGGTSNGTLKFTYDASGMKLRKEVFNPSNLSLLKQDYVGRIEYVNGVVEAIYTSDADRLVSSERRKSSATKALDSEGNATYWIASSLPATASWRYEYNVTDHLEEQSVSFAKRKQSHTKWLCRLGIATNWIATITYPKAKERKNNTLDIAGGEIINQNAYFPFGMLMSNAALANNASTPDSKYQFGNKEYNSDLGLNLLDQSARWYDPTIARFTTVDPLGEVTPAWNPYRYGFNNPIRFNDPTGMSEESEANYANIRANGARTKNALNGDSDGDPPGILATLYDKWQSIKNNLFGKNDEQPSDGEILHAVEEKGKDLETVAEYEFMFIPGGSFLNPKSTTSDKMVDLGASFVPGGILVKSGGKKAGQIVIKSLVKQDKRLLKLAKETFKGAEFLSKEANALIEQMFKGNWSPGIGTTEVFKGVMEARSRNGARVYFRQTETGAEILGYSNKNNQQKVIDVLKNLYE